MRKTRLNKENSLISVQELKTYFTYMLIVGWV